MEFCIEIPEIVPDKPELACSLDQRLDCHLVMIDGVAHLRLGQMCGLRQLFPGLRPPEVESELWLDTATSGVSYQGRRVVLTRTEFTVVAALAAGRGEFLSYQQIAGSIWGKCGPPRVEVLIRAHLRNIRLKLRAAGIPEQLLQTARGIGLRLAVGAGS